MAFHVKMSLSACEYENSFSYERWCTWPRFEKEAEDNTEMTQQRTNLLLLFFF